MKSWKKKACVVLSMAAAAATLAACGGNSNSAKSGSKKLAAKQEITYASTSDPSGLSTLDTNDIPSANPESQIYQTLFRLDSKTLKPKPVLATGYTQPNPTTYDIKLRKNVKFQDGTPFNSAAVKYTFTQLLDPKRASPRASLLAAIKDMTIKNDHEIVITTKYRTGTFIRDLSHVAASIVSPTADKKGSKYLMTHPVGTGPMKFKSWTQGDSVVLTRNNNYWGKKIKITKMTLKTVPDYSTAVSELQNGKVNFLDWLPTDYLKRIESIKGVTTSFKKGTRVNYFGFNVDKKPFNNKTFRQAVAYAINPQAYVKQASTKLAYYNRSIIGPKVYGYQSKMQDYGYGYDLAKAKKLVKENGFGKKTFTISISNSPDFVKMAQVIQAQLTKAGFSVKINKQESASLISSTTSGDYETMISSWSNVTDDASELLVPQLTSKYIGTSNRTRYSSATFDKLAAAGAQTTDTQARLKNIAAATKVAMDDAPWITIAHNNVSMATNKVHGIKVDATGTWHIDDAYVTQ